ncbi:cysteine-rich receptor-like protein kinase, partial [Trifolium medium]|nr:cysteine-rich receptor-like protein kinase [Trifolium medium]
IWLELGKGEVSLLGDAWFDDNVSRVVGHGKSLSFWKDDWLGGSLRVRFGRFFALSEHKDVSIVEMRRLGWGVGGGGWSWRWRLFACEEALVDVVLQDPVESMTCKEVIWNKLIPVKVSLFAWRFFSNRLPTKDNLLRHGVLNEHIVLCTGASLVWNFFGPPH